MKTKKDKDQHQEEKGSPPSTLNTKKDQEDQDVLLKAKKEKEKKKGRSQRMSHERVLDQILEEGFRTTEGMNEAFAEDPEPKQVELAQTRLGREDRLESV